MHPAHRSFSPDSSGHAYMDTASTWPGEVFSLSSAEEERAGERRPILSNAPSHEPTCPLTPSLSPTGGEGVRRTGEGETVVQGFNARSFAWENSHPDHLPTRSSQGEGDNFRWLYQDATAQRGGAATGLERGLQSASRLELQKGTERPGGSGALDVKAE